MSTANKTSKHGLEWFTENPWTGETDDHENWEKVSEVSTERDGFFSRRPDGSQCSAVLQVLEMGQPSGLLSSLVTIKQDYGKGSGGDRTTMVVEILDLKAVLRS